jgi:HPt (histidine-containing phosphotransfer) domain-containing protein
LLNADKFEEALAVLHRVRGGAGQVGARRLHIAASRLEAAIGQSHDSTHWAPALENLAKETEIVMPAIRKATSAADTTA